MGTLAPKHRVSSEALTDEGGGGAQRRVVDEESDACNHVRAVRPGPATVNELANIYLTYSFMKNQIEGLQNCLFLPNSGLLVERSDVDFFGLWIGYTAHFARMDDGLTYMYFARSLYL